ncbi:cupin domain-containing protein [Halomicrococcus gelatinilyticus]|uniref:cupin domain-containing protein n=1 Tax=Halomicrococcus gelatinilyticus TaxID=1702103 RepID=UPI002E133C9A
MRRASVDDPASNDDLDAGRTRLSEHLATTDVAVTHYRLGPGDGFPGGLHAHADQEEVFVVLAGESTFDVYATDDESADSDAAADGWTVTVRAGEAIRFARDEFRSGRNDADRDLVAIAVGAPPDSEDVRVPLSCPACGRVGVRPTVSEDGVQLGCPDCGAARTPRACPACGREEMQVGLGEASRPVAVCPDCDTEVADPLSRG